MPAVLRQVQVWQMPMRQPNWGLSPACSACSSSDRPLFGTSSPARAKLTLPSARSLASASEGGRKLSTWSSCSMPSSAQILRADSISPGGPQT